MLGDRSRGRVAGSGSKGYGDRERRGVEVSGEVWWDAILLGEGRRRFGKKYKKMGRGG